MLGDIKMCVQSSQILKHVWYPSDWIEPMASTTVNYRRLQTLNQGKSQCMQAYAGVTIPVMCVAVVRSAALH